MKDMKEKKTEVTYGGSIVGAGVTMGVVIAVSVPAIVLTLGEGMPGWMQGLAVIVAVLVGGAVMLTSVFFGIVIPRKIQTNRDKGSVTIGLEVNRKKDQPPTTPDEPSCTSSSPAPTLASGGIAGLMCSHATSAGRTISAGHRPPASAPSASTTCGMRMLAGTSCASSAMRPAGAPR